MSYALWVMMIIILIIAGFFIWIALLWSCWNYTIPQLTNSLAGSPPGAAVAFTNISYPTGIVFGFLIIFLVLPVCLCHRMVNYNFWVGSVEEVIEVDEIEVEPRRSNEYMMR